jgi:hypothetical protein
MTAAHGSHVAARFVEAASLPALAGLLSIAVACGGGGSPSGPSPSSSPSSGGTGSGPSATITIGSAVAPRDVRIETGESIRLVNNSAQVRAIKSDPHPTHGTCPPIDDSAALQPGASVVVGPFRLPGTCYYHDHNEPENSNLRGQIRVGVDDAGPGPNYLRP